MYCKLHSVFSLAWKRSAFLLGIFIVFSAFQASAQIFDVRGKKEADGSLTLYFAVNKIIAQSCPGLTATVNVNGTNYNLTAADFAFGDIRLLAPIAIMHQDDIGVCGSFQESWYTTCNYVKIKVPCASRLLISVSASSNLECFSFCGAALGEAIEFNGPSCDDVCVEDASKLIETFPNKFNTYFEKSLYNRTFTGSTGTWTVYSDENATMVVTTPYYLPSTSYALKVVNFKTNDCGSSGWTKAISPKVDLSQPCCPSGLKMTFTLWTYEVNCYDSKARLEFDFSSDNGNTWTEVWSKTSAQLYNLTNGDNGKTTITIPVPLQYQNANFRYRIRGMMDAGDYNNFYVFIDDIKIGSPANCTPLGSIGDYVWKDLNENGIQDINEPGISNATVKLTKPDNTVVTQTTNASGNYLFTGLAAGTYKVTFTTPTGLVPTSSNQGSDDAKDSDPVNGVVTVILGAGENNKTIDAGFVLPCTNTVNHKETFPNKFNSYFEKSLYNRTFTGSTGTWTVYSDENATMVVTTPYYLPSTSYALKVVNFKTQYCGSGWTKAISPKVDLSQPCCPSELKMTFTLWTYEVNCYDSKARLEFDFSSDNGATWTEVWSKTSAQLYSMTNGDNGKTTITIPVPLQYQNANFRYRIRGMMDAGDYNNFYVFIDDIKIGSPESCSTSSPMVNGRTMNNGNSGNDEEQTETTITAKGKNPVQTFEEIKINFTVNVFPNPTSSEYEMRVASKENTPVSIKIMDMLGRVIHTIRTAPNQSVRFGSNFKSGNYIVELTQGERTETLKLIKL